MIPQKSKSDLANPCQNCGCLGHKIPCEAAIFGARLKSTETLIDKEEDGK